MKLSFGKCWGLLFFDIIGLTISGYAFLLGYQVLATLANANAYIILMAFFVGIKVIVLALYDLNRNMLRKNIPFIAGGISILGNVIIFAMCFFLISEVPSTFFIGLTISDFFIVTLSHFLWWVLIGKDDNYIRDEQEPNRELKKKSKKEQTEAVKYPVENSRKKRKRDKKTWLSPDEDEESEYDSIFTSLLEYEKRGQQNHVESLKTNEHQILEDEKRYQTSDFLNEIKENLKKDNKIPVQKTESISSVGLTPLSQRLNADQDRKPAGSAPAELSEKGAIPTESDIIKAETPIKISPQIATPEATNPISLDSDDSFQFTALPSAKDQKSESKKGATDSLSISGKDKTDSDDDGGFLSIERRLGYLFHEIEKSMKETHYLQGAISDFQKEVENYEPIVGDEKIVAAGNLIREKLKMIIDKQFVVDEVLDDLIRLSKLINKRISDLDVIEAGLNQRKIALDQKDLLLVEARNRNPAESEIEILPEEVVLENLDSEFIVAEGDYESIRKYLTENPEA